MDIFFAGVLVGVFIGCLAAIGIGARLLAKAEPKDKITGELFESARDFSDEVKKEL